MVVPNGKEIVELKKGLKQKLFNLSLFKYVLLNPSEKGHEVLLELHVENGKLQLKQIAGGSQVRTLKINYK